MRQAPITAVHAHRAIWIAAMVLAAALLGAPLLGCSAQQGNGGVPTVTVQPPSGSVSPTASGSPSPTAQPSASPSSASPPPSATPQSPSPSASGGGGLAQGAAIFAANCTGCHGKSGEGGIGPDLQPLTAADVQKVVTQVTDGGKIMPSFKGKLTSAQIQAVADYVVTL
jgi:mono/diheme cytochrome c family protein